MNMKYFIIIVTTLIVTISFSQEKEEADLLAIKKANSFVYEGNQLSKGDDFVTAEMAYRKAISENASSAVGAYNLANAYYKKGSFEEALYRQQQVVQSSASKEEKHKAFHNIGNILMQNKKCKEAVEAYKNALRNDPTDDETRYNFGLAKECAEQQKDQQDQNKDNKENQDKKDENKDKQDQKDQDKEGDQKEDPKDKGDQDKKEGDDKKDEEGKPKDEKQDQDKGKEDPQNKDQQKPQPQQGKLSDQQIKSLLEAMNNQEQKVQEKMNAEKQKGIKVKTEKDW
jgi:tetratricopeptide (TPR) repeat protein